MEEEEEEDGWTRKKCGGQMQVNMSDKRDAVTIDVKLPLCCWFVCAGDTSQLTAGDVFVDIDDEEPLVPDQVKLSFQLAVKST